jgi:hypothetical protein
MLIVLLSTYLALILVPSMIFSLKEKQPQSVPQVLKYGIAFKLWAIETGLLDLIGD